MCTASFLCGEDRFTGKNYEHRKVWVVDRLKLLTDIFAVEVCAYAIMFNHYHVVLHIHTTLGKKLSDTEILRRLAFLFDVSLLVQRFLANQPMGKAERDNVSQFAADVWMSVFAFIIFGCFFYFLLFFGR